MPNIHLLRTNGSVSSLLIIYFKLGKEKLQIINDHACGVLRPFVNGMPCMENNNQLIVRS